MSASASLLVTGGPVRERGDRAEHTTPSGFDEVNRARPELTMPLDSLLQILGLSARLI